MIHLTDYGNRVVDRLSMMGNWLAVVASIRNFQISWRLYRRTKGNIHLMNTIQVVVLLVHRFLYGIIPLFEIATCAYFPLLISLWHLSYVLFYVIMFMRLLILESDRHAIWFKAIGITLILVRFADWPYELALQQILSRNQSQMPLIGDTCVATWGGGVLILNFIGDSLANLFLSGMFVRRLYIHVRNTKTIVSRQHQLLESIARKSLICLILTFVDNLAMNLLKITNFIGDRSDAFTVYFELIESTLLVEALRVESPSGNRPIHAICQNCGMVLDTLPHSDEHQRQHSSHHPSINKGHSSKPSNNNNNPTESVLQDMAVFDTDSYVEDMKQPLSPSHRRPTISFQDSSNDMLVQSPMTVVSSLPSTATSTTFVSSPRRPLPQQQQQQRYLNQHPEWSNNDFRMF